MRINKKIIDVEPVKKAPKKRRRHINWWPLMWLLPVISIIGYAVLLEIGLAVIAGSLHCSTFMGINLFLLCLAGWLIPYITINWAKWAVKHKRFG